ncbi:C-C motif chemokine 26 [Lemmus lemmus]
MKSPGQRTVKPFSLSSIVLLAFFLSVHLGAATRTWDQHTHALLPPLQPQDASMELGVLLRACQRQLSSQGCDVSVRFTTKQGKKVCVQPQAKWVQRYISLLKAQKHQ